MSKSISDRIASLKRIRLARAAVVVAASFVFLLSTACNPSSPSVSGTGSYQEGRQPQTELYRPIEPNEGGMNSYSDTDPRQSGRGLAAQTKARVEEAERNLGKAENRREFADEVKSAKPFKEGAKDVSDRAGDTIESLKQDVSKGTQRGIQNLQRNTEQAKQGVQDVVDDARQNVKQLGDGASDNAKRAADQLKDNLSNTSDDVKRNVKQNINRLQDNAKDTANQVEDAVSPRRVGQLDRKTGSYQDRLAADRSGSSVVDSQSNKQGTPQLDAGDLVERAKDTFSTATKNVGEFVRDTAADPQRAAKRVNDTVENFQ
jgi:F0F1-type ATP synthase membrane subunit b/b'